MKRFVRDGDTITLTMSVDDYDSLLVLLGMAVGAMGRVRGKAGYQSAMTIINRLNEGNQQFQPYEIPDGY